MFQLSTLTHCIISFDLETDLALLVLDKTQDYIIKVWTNIHKYVHYGP